MLYFCHFIIIAVAAHSLKEISNHDAFYTGEYTGSDGADDCDY